MTTQTNHHGHRGLTVAVVGVGVALLAPLQLSLYG